MGKHQKKQSASPTPSENTQQPGPGRKQASPRLSRQRLWLFRLLAVIGAPLVFTLLVELALRAAGYGHPTKFLLRASQNGQAVFIPNNQFGWRFFGRELARWPYPFAIPQVKGSNTIRIFVFGESAARGEPQPEFGVSRFLQTLLSLKYPGTRFEVVNTAMTAINSHTILPIARDCASAGGDIWVIYMGNNEVVGPFGAGTVFGSQTPPLPVIRTTLALKTTRTGQLLDSLLGGIFRPAADESVWGGMTLFLDQQVRADDPRMSGVYHHFAQNLSDIIRTGQRSGAHIVLSTMAVNLQDSPPFGSTHRPGLTDAEKSQWRQHYTAGAAAHQERNFQAAINQFQAAAKIDDTFAELRFRQGQCAQALGDDAEARRQFAAARDLDTLRFRCDANLNLLIREAATNHAKILLADAERAFAEPSAKPPAGDDFFYEHVHLTPPGNYRLAYIIAEQVSKALPPQVVATSSTDQAWATETECGRRLGVTEWSRLGGLNSIITTLNDPPFTAQLGHAARMQRWESMLAKLAPVLQPARLSNSVALCEAALRMTPDDAPLHAQLALLKRTAGDLPGATAAARREVELLPNDQEGWSQLGSLLAQQGRLDEAAAAFHRAFRLGPQGIKSMLNLGAALASLGKHDEALAEYQRVLKRKPHSVPALLQMGTLLEKLGRQADADAYFHQALTNRSQRLPELVELGGFFQNRGDFAAAAEVFKDACRIDPADARLQLSAGHNLASLGRYVDAEVYSAAAVRLSPKFAEAHLLHGIVLLRRGQPEAARAQFAEALQLRPDSLEARINLGVTLAELKLNAEALAMFDDVLARSPTNPVALKFVRSLRENTGSRAAPGPNLPPP